MANATEKRGASAKRAVSAKRRVSGKRDARANPNTGKKRTAAAKPAAAAKPTANAERTETAKATTASARTSPAAGGGRAGRGTQPRAASPIAAPTPPKGSVEQIAPAKPAVAAKPTRPGERRSVEAVTGAQLYADLLPKVRRIVEVDVATLFSRAAFTDYDIENVRKYGLWRPHVEHKGRWFYLSDKGISALRRLQDTVACVPALASAVSRDEVFSEVSASLGRFTARVINESVVPEGQDVFVDVADRLLASVKRFTFLGAVHGVRLDDDVTAVELGSARIQRCDRQVLENIQFGGGLPLDAVYRHFEDRLWFIASVTGSPGIAAEKLRYRAALASGLLALYGAVLYRGAFWKTRLRLISPTPPSAVLVTLRWEPEGANPTVRRDLGDNQELPVTADSLAYMARECFFRQLADLPDLDSRSDLQNSILTSLYWFADAYSDPNPTMKFVKLWSCMESFFSIDKEGITDLNAKGIAAVLTYAGYNVSAPAEYPKLKARLKKMYGMRSEAVHGGRVGHIETANLDMFARWVAWVIISMASLSDRGVLTLRQVQQNVARLDALHVATDARAPKDMT